MTFLGGQRMLVWKGIALLWSYRKKRMPFSLSTSSERAWTCKGLYFKCHYLYWNCSWSPIDKSTGCCLLISLDLDHKYLAWWARFSCCCQSPWLAFLSWSYSGRFLSFVTVLFPLSLLFLFPHLPVRIFQGLVSCLYLFSQKNMLLPTHLVYDFQAENFFTPSRLSPCSDPSSDFAASHFFISSWPLACSQGHAFSSWGSPSLLAKVACPS